MTDEERTRLRGAIELFLIYAERMVRPQVSSTTGRISANIGCSITVQEATGEFMPGESRPLTPDKQLALSVLLGDPDTLTQALADYLIDIGHEATVAAYERGKRDAVADIVTGSMVKVYGAMGRVLQIDQSPSFQHGNTSRIIVGHGWHHTT